jgi:apolipoprotein N-acyltransferase
LATRALGLVLFLASAGLHALAFPLFDLPEAAYVFAIPLLLWGLSGRSFRGEGIALLVSGWLGWCAILFWLRNFTQHLEIPFASALGWLALLALSLILAMFWWAWGSVALRTLRLVRERGIPSRLAALLGLAAFWIILEWLRGWLFTGFPWLTLAASQWQRPLLLQIASVTGSGGVSFILAGFNLGLAFYLFILWRNRKAGWLKRLSFEFYLSLVLLFGAIAYGLHTSGAGRGGRTAGPRIAFVQPDVGAVDKWDSQLMRANLATLRDLTVYASYLGPDLVLWPESPTPLPVKGNASMREWTEALSGEVGLPLLIGNIAREGSPSDPDRSWYNAVFQVNPQTGVDVHEYYRKRHLVPFGEYVPGWIPLLNKVVPVEAEFSAGTSAAPVDLELAGESTSRVGLLVCYEDIFPQLARANTLSGAEWHYVATNDAWYGREAGAYQHAAHSVLRAVETRRPVVRCGNAGWSGWIDEFGHIRHVMRDENGSIYFQGVEAVEFSLNPYWRGRLSPYVRHGDWFTLVCAGLSCLLPVLLYWRRSGSD